MEPDNFQALDPWFTLSEDEENEYQDLLKRQQGGETLRAYNVDNLLFYAHRRARKPELASFRERYEREAFSQWQGVLTEDFEQTNLPAKIAYYARGKQHRKSLSSLKTFADQELIRQPALKEQAVHEIVRCHGPQGPYADNDKLQIRLDCIERVYEEFQKHVELDISNVEHRTTIKLSHSLTAQPEKNDKAQKMAGLFSFGVQPNDIIDLINQTLLDPSSGKPLNNAKLRITAIAYALKHHKVIKLPSTKFAALIGEIWNVPFSPRRNDQGPVWDELFEPLRNDVLSMKTNAMSRQIKS